MTIVQCHGCFELFHHGHLKHLQYAKTLGDSLIVTITADQYIKKGGCRPIFNQRQRIEMLLELRCVDDAIIIFAPDAITALEEVKPDIYVKGKEYEGQLPEQQYCDEHGIKTVFYSFNDIHSSQILRDGL